MKFLTTLYFLIYCFGSQLFSQPPAGETNKPIKVPICVIDGIQMFADQDQAPAQFSIYTEIITITKQPESKPKSPPSIKPAPDLGSHFKQSQTIYTDPFPTLRFADNRGYAAIRPHAKDTSHDWLDTPDYNEYVLVNINGKIHLKHKAQIKDYVAQYTPAMVTTENISWWFIRATCNKFRADPNHYRDHFKDMRPEQIFHHVAHYRYPGFCKYVKTLPGFENFILGIGPELKTGTALHKKMSNEYGGDESFRGLRAMYDDQLKALVRSELARKRALLSTTNFNADGLDLLAKHKLFDQFLYHKETADQESQFKNIATQVNKLGTFYKEYHDITELNAISEESLAFTTIANNANRENLVHTSQLLLDVSQHILALGQGIVNSCGRNVKAIYEMCRYPGDTISDLGQLVYNVSASIGKALYTVEKFKVAIEMGDQQMLAEVNASVDRRRAQFKAVYQAIKNSYTQASSQERCELAGGLLTDALFIAYGGKIIPAATKILPLVNLAKYKPQIFAKLNGLGRQITQLVGLAGAKGFAALRDGMNIIEYCPGIVPAKKSIFNAIKHCNKQVK